MKKRVLIIGGGIAGIQTALTLSQLNIQPVLIEKEGSLGGKLNKWDRLFPSMTPAHEVLDELLDSLQATSTQVLLNTSVAELQADGRGVTLTDSTQLQGDAVVVASGFDLFDASRKEEYGYGLYENVYTTVDLERMFKSGKILTAQGTVPKTIALLHCVGSRDEKVNQRHCSRVCCITGVKQAIELKQALPEAEIYSFYMDMRMFGPGYEELYRQAQLEYNIHFVRGRISEAAQTLNHRIQIKAEDTLVGRPMKMDVDMLILIVGMQAGASNLAFSRHCGVELYPSGFVKPSDVFVRNTCSGTSNVVYAGTVTAPKNIPETINEAIVSAHRLAELLTKE